jgi:cbb3-type cytochrome oxidase subunit 3
MGNEYALTFEAVQAFAASAGLVIFIAGFVLVLIYTFLPSNRRTFDRASHLPLEKDPDDNSPRGHYGQN